MMQNWGRAKRASFFIPSLLVLSGSVGWAATAACSTGTSTAPSAQPYSSTTIPDSGTLVSNDLASINTAGGCAGVDVSFNNFVVSGTGLTVTNNGDATYIYNGSNGTPDDSLTFSSIRGTATVATNGNPNDSVINFHSNSASQTGEIGFVVDGGGSNVYNTFTLVLTNYITNNKATGNAPGIDFTVAFCIGGDQSTLLGTSTTCSGGGTYETFSIPRIGPNITTPTTSTYTFTLASSGQRVWVDNFMNLNGTGTGQLGTNLVTFTDSFNTPEPSAFVLSGLGLAALAFMRRRRCKA